MSGSENLTPKLFSTLGICSLLSFVDVFIAHLCRCVHCSALRCVHCSALSSPALSMCSLLSRVIPFKAYLSGWKDWNREKICSIRVLWETVRFQSLSILTQVLLNPDIPCICKQCRSRSADFWRSQLIWLCTVCYWICEFQKPGSSNLIGWKLEVGMAS